MSCAQDVGIAIVDVVSGFLCPIVVIAAIALVYTLFKGPKDQ